MTSSQIGTTVAYERTCQTGRGASLNWFCVKVEEAAQAGAHEDAGDAVHELVDAERQPQGEERQNVVQLIGGIRCFGKRTLNRVHVSDSHLCQPPCVVRVPS